MKYLFLFILGASVSLEASEPSFSEAFELAKKHERKSSTDETQKILEAQARIFSMALPECYKSTGDAHTSFNLVVQIDISGAVINSWLDKPTPYTLCFRDVMVREFSYIPKVEPFHTVIEYKYDAAP